MSDRLFERLSFAVLFAVAPVACTSGGLQADGEPPADCDQAPGGCAAGGTTGSSSGAGASEGVGGSGAGGSGGEDPGIPVTLPSCDTDDPEVMIIESEADLQQLDSDAHRIFCIVPGDYTGAGAITITSDGSEGEERWLRWFDPDDPGDDQTHPHHMAEARQALIDRITFSNAHHWVVDRIRFARGGTDVTDESSHIMLNRILYWEQILGSRTSVRFSGESHHNVIQYSVIAKTPPTPYKDAAGVFIRDSDYNQILSNEIFDIPGDSIQTGQSQQHARGTIIRDNDLYSTSAMYTDCNGSLDPSGPCGAHENAIDIKAHWGPNDETVPKSEYMVIDDNRMWGWRGTDNAVASSGSGPPGSNYGTPLVIHYWTSRAVKVSNNKVWDTDRGYTVSKNEDQGPICCHEVYGNVFHVSHQALKVRHIDDSTYFNNVLIGATYGFQMTSTAYDDEIFHNVLIDIGEPLLGGGSGTTMHDNAFFSGPVAGSGSNIQGTAADAAHEDLCFTIKRITNPEMHCIPQGKVTAASPHAAWFEDPEES